MTDTIQSYPLIWPPGWPRSRSRADAAFRTGGTRTESGRRLELNDGVARVFYELAQLSIREEAVIISSNVRTQLGRTPLSQVNDPGVAVYWTDGQKRQRCIAIDRYSRVADNLGAIAATLEAMRAIQRHGGAEILERAFTGFTALAAPASDWATVLAVPADASVADIESAYRRKAMQAHPDRGGSSDDMAKLNAAREAALSHARTR